MLNSDGGKCECGRRLPAHRTRCEECARGRRRKRYDALPLVEWDGDPLWDCRGEVFLDEERMAGEAWRWSEEDHPWLTPCKHAEPPLFSIYDFLIDVFDIERDLPDGWEEVESAVNDYVRSIRDSLDWVPDRTRRIDWQQVKASLGVEVTDAEA